jgi:hypothetical protein
MEVYIVLITCKERQRQQKVAKSKKKDSKRVHLYNKLS